MDKGYLFSGSSLTLFALDSLVKSTLDGKPDLFSFNFMGYSGEFFFGNDGEIHLVSQNALKIEYDVLTLSNYPHPIPNPRLRRFIITDDKGVKYYFDDLEMGRSFSNVDNNVFTNNNISSWFLSKVIGTNGEEIRLTYEYQNYNETNIVRQYSEKLIR